VFLNAYGELEMIIGTVYIWFEQFEEGKESIWKNERCGRPNVEMASHIAAVKAHFVKLSVHVAIHVSTR